MDRILNMILRQVINMVVRGGAKSAMRMGQSAWNKRSARKTEAAAETIDHDSGRRPLGPDDRKGDEVLYPTDNFSEEMQPRK